MGLLLPWLFVSLAFSSYSLASTAEPVKHYYVPAAGNVVPLVRNVLDYGAVGDGVADDSTAFSKAWSDACSNASFSIMLVPADKNFFIHPMTFSGPCYNPISFEVNGNVVGPTEPLAYKFPKDGYQEWIRIQDVNGMWLHGTGQFIGRGEHWWGLKFDHKAPTTLLFSVSSNVNITGLTFKNSPRMHLVIQNCKAFSISDVTIDSPGDSPNTDGIHVTGSVGVLIQSCIIRTGDDCISIVSGSSYLNINNIICGPGHGISVGSLGKHGAEDNVQFVHVSDVIFKGSKNGARIKTWQGGRGVAQHMVFERILSQGSDNPIIIDQNYCDHEICHEEQSAVKIYNITFRKVLGTSMKNVAMNIVCSKTFPCTMINLDDIYLISESDKNNELAWHDNAFGVANGTYPNITLSSAP